MVGTTVVTTGAKIIGAQRAKKKARSAQKKADKQIKERTAKQSKELQKGTDAQVRAEKDVANVYEGMTSISPETAYARNQSERATSSAIDKAMRSGSSTGEIMNMVSGLTAAGQNQGQKISAAEETRRKQAMVAAKMQSARAAAAGLAGKQAQIDLEDKAYGMTENKNQQINQAAAQNYAAFSGMVDDIGSIGMMAGGAMGEGGMGVNELTATNVGGKVKGQRGAGNPYNL